MKKRAFDEGSVAICLKQISQVIGDLFGGAPTSLADREAEVSV